VVAPAAGGVVLVPFPFSDLSEAKLRPAVVLADAGRGDWILCQDKQPVRRSEGRSLDRVELQLGLTTRRELRSAREALHGQP